MNSVLTNVAAMTALQTLNQTNKELLEVQNRISTGYRVADASDNAAYWSIATTMRSDNSALSTVRDALGLDRCHLLGQSWGGWLSIEYLCRGTTCDAPIDSIETLETRLRKAS